MHTTHALPSHFGRSTVIASDHQELAGMLDELARLCSALEVELEADLLRSNGLYPDRLIGTLHSMLARHFAEEETEDYFGAMVRERPSLVLGIGGLRADHAYVLEALEMLEAIAADEQRWPELPVPARRLIRVLKAHEQQERLLVEEFLTSRDD